ncbi:AAT domain-containing protein [Trichoderma chlorosporum]
MLEITCSGSPYEIGYQHGRHASHLVRGSLSFYEGYFLEKNKMSWSQVLTSAEKFMPFLQAAVPDLVDEMKGVADGVGVPFLSILALNCRSEISMGLMDDGCTSVAWKTDQFSVAGQNWDWSNGQKRHLILLHIKPSDSVSSKPTISQITEAGIIGKIGINSAGVGVFLNAIRAKGVNFNALPVHLALRTALESASRLEAIARLSSAGFATAGHIMIADSTGTTSLEFSTLDVAQLEMFEGRIAHTNHFLAKHHESVVEATIFPDSFSRMERITELMSSEYTHSTQNLEQDSMKMVQFWLKDEDGLPMAINRHDASEDGTSTLFSIVVDLNKGTGIVNLGRPTNNEGTWKLYPSRI